MSGHRKRVKFKGDSAVVVPIQDVNEQWTEISLDDGSNLRIKLVVTRVIRLEDKYDGDGAPVYVVTSVNVTAVEPAESLCRPELASSSQVR